MAVAVLTCCSGGGCIGGLCTPPGSCCGGGDGWAACSDAAGIAGAGADPAAGPWALLVLGAGGPADMGLGREPLVAEVSSPR